MSRTCQADPAAAIKLLISRPALIGAFARQGRDIAKATRRKCVRLFARSATLSTTLLR
ncbi:hypothetical protein [Desulforudis sp. DRI-14]|uniref:hypothetical protein n=1 Tax=Desulforudis sp. DRI-14 TaxID=3459793 RepID=UPI0040421713